jgi:branched-chain amino acid aminotransferase
VSASGPVAWVNGALIPRSEARISIDDFSARYGAACFETMLVRHGRVFRLDAHLNRLVASLRSMRVSPPELDALVEAVAATVSANGLEDASVRLTVTAGSGGAPDLAAAREPVTVVTADPLPAASAPVRLRIASVRIDERRTMAEAKTANFLPYLLARAEAREAGADDALLLNHAGKIVEAATANLFVLIDRALITPPLEDGPLPGITRAAVIEVAHAARIPCVEESLTPADLAAADALVLTSSVQGIVPVASVEGGGVAWQASGEAALVIEALRGAYEEMVERECAAGL